MKSFNTQGIKYAGSKLKLLPYIADVISDLNINSVLDGFSGTTRVSQALAQMGYNVTSNDISVWSKCFATCYLLHNKPVEYYQRIIDELNELQGVDGWFTEHYGGELTDTKKPFQKKNTMKLDAIRQRIDEMELDEITKSVILTSLILALDSVDSTLGHQSSYLANWSKRSYKDMVLQVPNLVETTGKHKVTQMDIFTLVSKPTQYDLAYFDPPYGSNNEKMPPSRVRYASYYHIWKSVILNDRPEVFGKANRREDSRDTAVSSLFEEYRKNEKGEYIAVEAIRNLITQTKSHYILLSYSSGGRATEEELIKIIKSEANLIKCLKVDYKKNVMAEMKWTNKWANTEPNQEYLFLLEK